MYSELEKDIFIIMQLQFMRDFLIRIPLMKIYNQKKTGIGQKI